MHRRLVLAALIASVAQPAFAQLFSEADAARALREALRLAATNATTRLGRANGFWSEGRVRIPLPGMLAQAQRGLRNVGMSRPLDDLQESLNHAAETTMPEAGRLFVNAVRSITITDAVDIVRGGDDSATRYLRGRTETRLTQLLKPPMTQALTSSGAFGLMRTALRQTGMSSMSGDVRTEIINFSTTKALDGCFLYIAEEERAIRRDPVRRTSDILRQVFGR
jgi:hypothetical protein